MILSAIGLAVILQSHDGNCQSAEHVGAGWLASARLEEIAEERAISEIAVGGLLVLWDRAQCDSIDRRQDKDDDTAISREGDDAQESRGEDDYELAKQVEKCARFVELPRTAGTDFPELAREHVLASKRKLATLVWVELNAEHQPQHHVISASPEVAIKSVHAGYGRAGAVQTACIANPWFR